MKVLVTGASGSVGQHVVRELEKLGESVVAAGTNPDKLLSIFGLSAEAVTFDFTCPETFRAALSGVDRVFLMRPPHLGKPEDLCKARHAAVSETHAAGPKI